MNCPYCNKYISLEWHKIRSMPQNRYYWGVILKILSDDLGYDQDRIHELMKDKFLTEKLHIKNKDGTVTEEEVPKSTRNITTQEAEEYFERIKQWGAEYRGLYIPDPNEETNA